MTYKQLPIVEVDLDNLLLDLDNYRIPTRPEDEAGALNYLYSSEDVLGAARLILRDGYFDNEVPIATPAPGAMGLFVVLEGNRRVSALKSLQDPTIVPGREKEIRTLLKRYAVEAQSLPDRIRVLVAPDRASAEPHIARLHTRVSKKRWSRDQQATFYYSLLDEQTTVDDVKARYPGVDVSRFLKMAVMRRFLVAVPFSDQNLREYAASSDLKMSVFEYAYRSKGISEAIGVAFDSDGLLSPRTSKPEKIATTLPEQKLDALEYLVGEFHAGHLNTRSPEFKKGSREHHLLLSRLRGVDASSPDPPNPTAQPTKPASHQGEQSQTTSDSNSSRSGSAQASSDTAGSRGSRGPNHPDTKDTLDLSGLKYDDVPVNLKRRYHELRSISLSTLPISAALLLRSVLEATIKVHFEDSEASVEGELKRVFEHFASKYGSEKKIRHFVAKVKSGGAEQPGSIVWFNLAAHSADAVVTEDQVRTAWSVVNPLLRRLLNQRPSTADVAP